MAGQESWSIRVRWHPCDGEAARVEWLELPPELAVAGISRRSEWISSYLREREGLPPDSRVPGERVLWFEEDMLRTADEVERLEREAEEMRRADAAGRGGY